MNKSYSSMFDVIIGAYRDFVLVTKADQFIDSSIFL